MFTAGIGQDAVKGDRIHWLDNLRTFMILLVIVIHAGGVYESSGIWAFFWIVDDPSTNDLCGLVNIVLDIFVMATLFFISGYLVPASMKCRNGREFLRAKFRRLVVPWAVAVLTLIPIYKVIFLYSRDLPQELWATYFHWSNGIWSQNWLWFLPVLFLFNFLYLTLSKLRGEVRDISLKGAALGTFCVGFIYSVSMDTLGLQGWTKIGLIDFQNERLLIYFMFFLLGALCFRLRVFDGQPKGKILYGIANAVAWIPITVYIVFLLFPWFNPGVFLVSEMMDRLILWFSYHLSLFCLVYVTIETFRRFQNRQGRVRHELNRNSYYVYIIHVVVIGVLACLMLNIAVPSMLKYLILTVSTFVGSHLIVSLFKRVPALLESRSGQSASRTRLPVSPER